LKSFIYHLCGKEYKKMNKTQDYIASHKDRFVAELVELLKIPSVSADKNYSEDVHKAAKSVADS
jgi:acetylornithine deacetylase/succinyl-diaminopimelate desuccinylase-like protein